ncbi:hypothetical protein CASFOL_008734 [Castilleja foliolosa]|uniref:KIB1-4 beta-propeller domain-containing protein n=1 Tax=Castilleja foliolosa TaxID=1961234 RepID=A0ABD3DZV4_9LAMI
MNCGHRAQVSCCWLAFFNHRRNELFLSNPLSGHRVNLPPIDNLDITQSNLSSGVGIKKIIISCFDPESEECRAIMLFDITNKLAFCCPCRSTKWTIIESSYVSSYQDFVYCSTNQLLFSIKTDLEFEACDLRTTRSPSLVWSCRVHKLKPSKPSWEVGYDSDGTSNLEKENELFLVYRYINRYMKRDGSCAPMDGHLNDQVIFVGWLSHGMAMPATDADGFQPNTICFSDDVFPLKKSVRGSDNGIYDYKNKTFHPCYYHCDYQNLKKKIMPRPLWLTPH